MVEMDVLKRKKISATIVNHSRDSQRPIGQKGEFTSIRGEQGLSKGRLGTCGLGPEARGLEPGEMSEGLGSWGSEALAGWILGGLGVRPGRLGHGEGGWSPGAWDGQT